MFLPAPPDAEPRTEGRTRTRKHKKKATNAKQARADKQEEQARAARVAQEEYVFYFPCRGHLYEVPIVRGTPCLNTMTAIALKDPDYKLIPDREPRRSAGDYESEEDYESDEGYDSEDHWTPTVMPHWIK